MTAARSWIGAAMFAAAVGVMLLLTARAVGQRDEYPSDRRGKLTLELQNSSPTARRIAHERYLMLKAVQSKDGVLYDYGLMTNGAIATSLFFPIGRSDRAYVVRWGADRDRCWCFQRKDGQRDLAYECRLVPSATGTTATPPAERRFRRYTSLLDYIKHARPWTQDVGPATEPSHGVSAGIFGESERADLAAKRDYVDYPASYGIVLSVCLLSDLRVGSARDSAALGEEYNLGRDPLTRSVLNGDGFYRKYGLPVEARELRLWKPGRSARATAKRRTRR